MVFIPPKIASLIRSRLRAFGTKAGFMKQKGRIDLESWNMIDPWINSLGDVDIVKINIRLFPEINFDKVKMASNMLIKEKLSTPSSFNELHRRINQRIRSSAACSKLVHLKNLLKELERDELNPIDFDLLQGCIAVQLKYEIWPKESPPNSSILVA